MHAEGRGAHSEPKPEAAALRRICHDSFSQGAFVHAVEDILIVDLHAALGGEVCRQCGKLSQSLLIFAVQVEVTLWTFSGCNGPPRPPISPTSFVKATSVGERGQIDMPCPT